MPATSEPNDDSGLSEGTEAKGDWVRTVRRYGPFGAVVVLVLATVVVFRGGANDGERPVGREAETDRETLVRSGPMTPEKAELLGEGFEHGPNCDPVTERIMLPTVYAPPCVKPSEGDNGGATSLGVTEDTIKLVFYVPKEDFLTSLLADVGIPQDTEPTADALQGYVDLYNHVFETYDRQVELEVYAGRGDANDEAQAQADAIEIAEMEPFAVIGGPFLASPAFSDELAARGVVCLPGCAGAGLSASFVEERAPHVWPDGMTGAQFGMIAGEAIGALVGPDDPAELAGDVEMHERERVYGLLRLEGEESEEMAKALEDRLADHGIGIEVDITTPLDINRVQEDTRNQIVQLKDAGVTTVIVTGAPFMPGFLTNEATEQGYFPEWILGPNFFADTRIFTMLADQDQWVNGFGIGYKVTANTTAGEAPGVYEWAYDGDEPEIAAAMPYIEPAVRMLFTGIHLAGPELTPHSFRDGLFRFPPSGDGTTSAVVSWGGHGFWPEADYGDIDDVTVIWWDPEAENPEAENPNVRGPGLYRLANGGQRYRLGEFPESAEAAGLFDEEPSVVMYGLPLPNGVGELFERYSPPELP